MGATELVDSINYCTDTQLEAQSGNRYGPQNLFDGDRTTAWCEGAAGDGVGELIILFINNGVPFNRLLIWNGYQKNDTSFRRNGRVKTIKVMTDQEPTRTFTLPDTQKQIAVPFDKMMERGQIGIEIRSVYPGTHYQDTCLSGLFADLESGRDYQPEPALSDEPPPAPTDAPPTSPPAQQDPAPDLREIAPLPDLPGL